MAQFVDVILYLTWKSAELWVLICKLLGAQMQSWAAMQLGMPLLATCLLVAAEAVPLVGVELF